jgi:transcriptional regulator with XRE-family HTH domain
MDVRRIVGENLRNYRVSARLSQEELAARMGVEQGYLSGLEAGRRNPTIVTLWHAAVALGIRPSLLLEVPEARLAKPALRVSSRRKARATKAPR